MTRIRPGLPNFSLAKIKKAVKIADEHKPRTPLEVSGNVNLENIAATATTGVDYISVGAITKNVVAIDFTMLFVD